MSESPWRLSHRADPLSRPIADRHYSRQKPGTRQFVNPGRCLVLRATTGDALWVTTFPYADYVHHAWPEAWQCAMFRNENPVFYLSSDLIRQAVAITRWYYGTPPKHGMVTFVDEDKTRRKRDPGRCFVKAGFARLPERTKAGLIVLRMLPEELPDPLPIPGAEPYAGNASVFDPRRVS